MSSRRRFLTTVTDLAGAALVGAGLGSTAGCLARTPLAGAGALVYKAIEGGWTHEGQPMGADLCTAEYDAGDGDDEGADASGTLRIRVADAYADLLTPTGDLRTTDAAMARLREDFESITFFLQFAPVDGTTNPDWYRAFASRRDFDRVRFGDRAAVRYDFPGVRVLKVYEGAQGDHDAWDVDVGLFDFTETYAHAGAPSA